MNPQETANQPMFQTPPALAPLIDKLRPALAALVLDKDAAAFTAKVDEADADKMKARHAAQFLMREVHMSMRNLTMPPV